ncbi:MAG: LLM class F420-dependent oxidoreductase [Sphingomonadales bacterium]|nr:LLM class F420-dependent oxidoreductase [Sphingomonadales bacterium]
MQLGVVYPQIELRGDPEAVAAIARATESQGYDYLLMFDHVAGVERSDRPRPLLGPYSEKDPFHDPLVTFGFVAGITHRIGLATGILVLPQRQTVLVARQAADVDLFSGGRLRLGVGVGWNAVEYQALGQDFHARGARLDEQIPLLRQLWQECPIAFQGKFDAVDRAGLNPLPRRTIPIWCGGGSSAAFRRAARLGDGFIFSGRFESNILPGWQEVQRLLEKEGRRVDRFGAECLMPDGMKLADAINMLRRWQDAGGTHFGVRTMGLGFTEANQHIDYIAEFLARI